MQSGPEQGAAATPDHRKHSDRKAPSSSAGAQGTERAAPVTGRLARLRTVSEFLTIHCLPPGHRHKLTHAKQPNHSLEDVHKASFLFPFSDSPSFINILIIHFKRHTLQL